MIHRIFQECDKQDYHVCVCFNFAKAVSQGEFLPMKEEYFFAHETGTLLAPESAMATAVPV